MAIRMLSKKKMETKHYLFGNAWGITAIIANVNTDAANT
jgi:hypothetical protein